jgi:hypothetical protein
MFGPRNSMPPGDILDRDIEYFKGTLYSCQPEYEMGTVPHFKKKGAARNYALLHDMECDPLIEENGIWVRVSLPGYDNSWHGPFNTRDEADAFVDKVWQPIRTGFYVDMDLEGVRKPLPAWARRK